MNVIGRLYSIWTALAAAITVAFAALCTAYFVGWLSP
jgi:F0F1-type ATP synthase membrane subunit c/vacuolar-type H+-ATPase subunit K